MTTELIIRRAESMISRIHGTPVKLVAKFPHSDTTLDVIKLAVCDEFRIKWEDIVNRSRKREIVIARQLFSYACMKHLSVGSSYLGRLLGRDHTSIIHNRRMVENFLSINDSIFCDHLRNIEATIEQFTLSVNNQPSLS